MSRIEYINYRPRTIQSQRYLADQLKRKSTSENPTQNRRSKFLKPSIKRKKNGKRKNDTNLIDQLPPEKPPNPCTT